MKDPTKSGTLKLLLNAANTGNNSTISTSKIRKIMARRKNRREKGSRADFIGSNPHSKGELFSRSPVVRFDSTQPNTITTQDSTIARTLLKTVLNISAKEINLLC